MRLSPLSVAFVSFALASSLSAQDLIGVNWSGQTVLVDSYTAAVTPLGTGSFGQNALARDARGRLWTTQRSASTPYVYDFVTLDRVTGTTTLVHPGTIDIRGWADAGSNQLFGITLSSGSTLVLIDLSTGANTVIGRTGFSSIQGLAMHQGVLYGWDLSRGLVTIDTTTGVGTDPFPGVAGPTGLQYLCSHSDGRLLAGGGSSGNSLYSVDLSTGLTNLIGVTSGASDLRGLEQFGGAATSFGQGCAGSHGLVNLTVSGTLQAGGQLNATSNNHLSGAPGILIIGTSASNYVGLPLPFSLDPIIGTSGCSLYASLDVQFGGSAGVGVPADLQFILPIPLSAGDFRVYLQHACFEPVPGNMSWSNGVELYVSY